MPGYKAHLTGGLIIGGMGMAVIGWIGVFRPSLQMVLILLGIALLGSLFPDIDTDSKGQHVFYSLLLIFDLALMWKGEFKWAAILGFCAMLPALGHHRGWTHTWWAMLLVPLPIILLPMLRRDFDWQHMVPFYLAFAGGYFSHLLLDRTF